MKPSEMKQSTKIILDEIAKKFPGQTDFRRAIIEDIAKSFGYTQKDYYPLLTPANRVKIGTYSLAGLLPEIASVAEPIPAAAVQMASSVTSVGNEERTFAKVDPTFVAWGSYTDIMKIIKSEMFYPTYISGLSGNGKTFMVEQACAKAGREFIRVQINPETDEDDDVDSSGCSDDQLVQDSDGDGVFDIDDLCPDSTLEVDANGCDENQRDTDGDGVNDGFDECPDTVAGYPVDSDGCFDEDALDQDLDGDGYLGEYTFDVDDATGLRINEAGDAFPLDGTQWFDQDGDGFGDNPVGNNADFCPTEFGTSYLDALEIGCEDDGDGWADNWGRDKFPGDATQWNDSDGDGYGDNWGVEAWNDSRDSSMPGEFVADASAPDKCPESPTTNVDDEGCSKSERDTDQDGVNDLLDNCPEQPKGPDGFDDGCPLPKSETDDGGTTILGMTVPVFGGVLAGGIVTLFLLAILIGRLRNRGYDYDDDDEDFFDDDEDDFFSSFQSKPMPSRSVPQTSATPSRGPPGSSGPSRGPSGPKRGSPGSSSPSGPKRGPPGGSTGAPSGPPGRGPPGRAKPTSSAPVAKISPANQKGGSKESEDHAPQKKVRRARIEIDLSLFEDWQSEDRDAAVSWVISEMAEGQQERTLLMQLQGTGWSAQQSRAIYDMARNQQ